MKSNENQWKEGKPIQIDEEAMEINENRQKPMKIGENQREPIKIDDK